MDFFLQIHFVCTSSNISQRADYALALRDLRHPPFCQMSAPTPVMIPRLVFAQTPHEGLVRCLKLQPQLVKAGSEPSFGFICTDAKSPPRTPAPSTIIIPRSPFAQMPPEGLALPVPLCLLRERGRSQQLSTGHLPRCHVQRGEMMPIGKLSSIHKKTL